MTGMDVSADETGVVRVFRIDLPGQAVAEFMAQELPPDAPGKDADGSGPLRDALGARHLDPAHVESVAVADLAAIGLSGYLVEGMGLPEDVIERDREVLDALEGHVLIVRSQAFGGAAQHLDPKPPLHPVGVYRETPVKPVIGSIESEAAKRRLAKRGRPVKHARTSPVLPILVVLVALAAGVGIVLAMAMSFG